MQNLIFIGMPASGKSSVGRAVARRLGYGFVDTDRLIMEQEGQTLEALIARVGNAGFLAIENQVNRDLRLSRCVIAPGGSVIYCQEAMEHFQRIGTLIYLQVSLEDLRRRIKSLKKRGVILAEGQSFRDLYRERTALFERYADITVNEDGFRREETVENVLQALKDHASLRSGKP